VPLLMPVTQAFRHQDRTIHDLLADPLTRISIAVMTTALLTLLLRGRLVLLVDRALIGAQTNHARSLAQSTEAITRGRTAREVAFETARQIAAAFDAAPIIVALVPSAGAIRLLSGVASPLPQETALLTLLADVPTVNVSRDGPLFGLLPPVDQEWLLRHRCDLLVRIPAPDREIGGVLGIGPRAGGLAFSLNDLSFVTARAVTTGLALARQSAGGVHDTDADDVGALECPQCGVVGASIQCSCAVPPRPARLPLEIAGRFEIARRIGQGGMGVVYAGRDLRLARMVALKTLPEVAGSAAAAMFDEAKTMAQVEHSHLATIYSLEVWRHTPVLVVEYLPGGTLADRLSARGAVPIDEALAIGAALADALSALHNAGILHRDIKPSNVGFTAAGVPKLLDFGVARLLTGASRDLATGPEAAVNASVSTALAGTPLYLSPEALGGARAAAAVDLWSCTVVVLEAIVGVYPLSVRSVGQGFRQGRQRDTMFSAECRGRLAGPLVEFFSRALAAEIDIRPQSAEALGRDLRAIRARLQYSAITAPAS
jgi:hypothetical protein